MIRIEEARFDQVPAMRQAAIASYTDTFADSNTPENLKAFLKRPTTCHNWNANFTKPALNFSWL